MLTREPSGAIAGAELTGLVDGASPLSVEFGQYSSAVTLLLEELGGVPFGAPPAWRKAAVSALDARDLEVLRPFVSSHPRDLPSSLCVLTHRSRSGYPPLEEDLERIAAIPPDLFAATLPDDGNWDAVARAPGAWLEAFARTMRRTCEGLRRPWRAAAGLLDREAERVGVAAVRGTERELLAARFPGALLRLEADAPAGAEQRSRLAMVPMLAGTGASHVWIVGGELTHIAYPVPDAWRLLDGSAPPPASLESLLGQQRARLLRRLDRPTTAGELAETLLAVPSAVSHHLARLESAGLVVRERRGRHVVVQRTARGSQVLALYDGD